jgi:hypothetical protein
MPNPTAGQVAAERLLARIQAQIALNNAVLQALGVTKPDQPKKDDSAALEDSHA